MQLKEVEKMQKIYPVTLDAMKTGRRQVCTVPDACLLFNQGPHYSPRQDGTQEQRYIYHVRANHSNSNVRG